MVGRTSAVRFNSELLAEGASADTTSPVRKEPAVVLSFDVEEHDRIEAASGLAVAPEVRACYRERLLPATQWLLDQLAESGLRATFFVVGEIAEHTPRIIRAIHSAGHEIASHSWDHRLVHKLDPVSFRDDVRKCKDALEQLTGQPVVGYRAPTFSIGRQNPWAIDVLVELGMRYDSSVFPIRHDRYGVPDAPRGPFRVKGRQHELLEFPPATLRMFNYHVPAGGGGYFRLFPRFVLEWAIAQLARETRPAVPVLYFHPWEFDPGQPRLRLRWLSRFRTYVGVSRSQERLRALFANRASIRACDAATLLESQQVSLPRFDLATQLTSRDGRN